VEENPTYTVAEKFKKRKIPAKIFEVNELEEFKEALMKGAMKISGT